MKLTVNENNVIQLEEVFSGVLLKTRDGEEMGICMRDTGFEFTYQGKHYWAKLGELGEFKVSERGNILVDQTDTDNVDVAING